MCEKHGVSEELKYEIMKISQIIIKQIYFSFKVHCTYKKDLLWVHQIHLYFLKYTDNTLKSQ
jgi:hypothetical protein